MCDPTTIMLLSAAASAGGTYMQMDAADSAANKKQNLITAAEEENQAVSKDGEKLVNDFAKDVFDPGARDKRYEDGIVQREESLGEALATANAAAPTAAAGGNVSGDYSAANAASKTAMGVEAAKQAKLMARTGGSGMMFGNEALMGGNLASDLGGVGQRRRRNNTYAQGAVGRVRDEGSLAGGLMQGAGSAGMSYYSGQAR